jgi:hypothetical protein
MRVPGDPSGLLDRLSLSSPQQRACRLGALLAGCLFLVLLPVSGGAFHPVLTAVAVLLAVLVALVPESNAPLGLLVYLGVLWMLAATGRLDVWSLAAAVDLSVLHVACTLASYGPPGLTLERRLLALWWRRFGRCAAAAGLVWAAARTLDFLDLPASGFALAVALVTLLAWVAWLSVRLTQGEP